MLAKEDGGTSRKGFIQQVESGSVLFWKTERGTGCFLGVAMVMRGHVVQILEVQDFKAWRLKKTVGYCITGK